VPTARPLRTARERGSMRMRDGDLGVPEPPATYALIFMSNGGAPPF
jgi:hypothetical protein